ncbi:MAG TPA: putative toxin-antitoxin system toxin component, PIN family [Gemmatimonadaceae bacterium]|nr:putative toxin-antitoxin system toxin component, PIN family [Gemmatimonadaceae bacterium]
MRVCLDTNVLVAAFATRGLCADVLRAVLADHDLVIGDVILAELRRTLAKKFGLPADRIEAVEDVLSSFPSIPRPSEPADVDLRDPDDRWILATAIAGEATVLVTGDRDLLDARQRAPIPILDPREFWEFLRENPSL